MRIASIYTVPVLLLVFLFPLPPKQRRKYSYTTPLDQKQLRIPDPLNSIHNSKCNVEHQVDPPSSSLAGRLAQHPQSLPQHPPRPAQSSTRT
jgi:hypothetical protein